MATMTGSTAPESASRTTKFQLISLMTSCIKHLEESDEYAPIVYQTSNKLHEYADAQSKQLQAQILKLQQDREQAMKQAKSMQHQQHQRHMQQQNAMAASKTQAAAEENNAANDKLSALEEQKRAAAEKRRQLVIEQRRKAALEQKKKEEERKRQFLERERRKEQLKAEAARQASQNKGASQSKEEQRIEEDAMSELDKIGGFTTSTESDEPELPIPHANLERITTPKDTIPNQTGQGAASPSTPLETASLHSSKQLSPSPMQHPPVPVPGQQKLQQESHPHQPLPPHPPLHTPPQHPHATQPPPLNETFGSISSLPDSVATIESLEDPPGLDIAEVKKQILIHWGLQPPGYQTLKRVDQLVVSIQAVFPPFAGVPAHSYFDGWNALTPNDFLCYGADGLLPTLDTDKLNKAVRKIRFFLHPDKLPRDMTEGQMYVCKLLWDVTSDALEEFKKSQAPT